MSIKGIVEKLAELKNTVNSCSDNLSLEDYDWLYGSVEELQYLADELDEGSRDVILEELIREALDKIDYLMSTPPDYMWKSKITDFQASAYLYLESGNISDIIYPHKFLKKGE